LTVQEPCPPQIQQHDFLPLPDLLVGRYTFEFRLQAAGREPEHLGTVLRGGLNWYTKQLVCMQPHLEICDHCLLLQTCTYPALFAPTPADDAEVLRTHNRVPPPYVVSTAAADAVDWTQGALLAFDITLIGKATAYLPHLILAAQRLGRQGLGSTRSPATLHSVCSHPVAASEPSTLLWADDSLRPDWSRFGRWRASQLDSPQRGNDLTLHFQSATRLKHDGQYVHDAPAFHIVIRTLLRRLSSLSYFHANQRWDLDYRGWIEQAEKVTISESDAHWCEWGRYSTRQKRHMNLGGIVGRTRYQGEISGFLPLLRLGELIHVGKGTVFGNGRYQVEIG
jgi:hypothetical protein